MQYVIIPFSLHSFLLHVEFSFLPWQFVILLHFYIISIIHNVWGLDRPLSALSFSLFKGLPSCLCPFGPQFSIICGILLLPILVTCPSQLDLYLLSFSSSGSAFNSSTRLSFLLSSKRMYPVLLKNFISIALSLFLPFCWRVKILLPCKRMGTASALHTFITENLWHTLDLKLWFRIPSIWVKFSSFYCSHDWYS